MIGMYTHKEMINMKGIITSVGKMSLGYICRHVGDTYNYYRQESDGSWTNYNCQTKYTFR